MALSVAIEIEFFYLSDAMPVALGNFQRKMVFCLSL